MCFYLLLSVSGKLKSLYTCTSALDFSGRISELLTSFLLNSLNNKTAGKKKKKVQILDINTLLKLVVHKITVVQPCSFLFQISLFICKIDNMGREGQKEKLFCSVYLKLAEKGFFSSET